MSLKSFHIFFILVSIALCFGLGFWGVRFNWILGAVGFVAALVLIFYFRTVLKKYKNIGLMLWCAFLVLPGPSLACSVCYGDPNSQMSKGLRMAVLALLAVVVVVLAFFAAFIFYLKNRAKKF